MSPSSFNARKLTLAAMIAAIYTVLTLILAPISYGEVQVRLSEALTLLPILFPEAIPGVTLGCLLANIFGGAMLPDIVFGTLATFLAAVLTYRFRSNHWLAASMPVLFNGLIVGAVVHFCYAPGVALPLCMLFVAVGEAISCYLAGTLLIQVLRRTPLVSKK
ncbi:MAG: QueT transporter family protein [Clostridia bacterium]|nr:QueT transporter family protein [Clostridia bacterium]